MIIRCCGRKEAERQTGVVRSGTGCVKLGKFVGSVLRINNGFLFNF